VPLGFEAERTRRIVEKATASLTDNAAARPHLDRFSA
jgi:hypothetical protein